MESGPVLPTFATPSEQRITRLIAPGIKARLASRYPICKPSSVFVDSPGSSRSIALRIALALAAAIVGTIILIGILV